MRFYLDEDLSQAIALLARRNGLDVSSSHEQQRDGYGDDTQLTLAAGEGRCLVTKNGVDFEALTRSFAAQGLPHAGVLAVPASLDGSEFRLIVERLASWADDTRTGSPRISSVTSSSASVVSWPFAAR